MAYHQDGYSGRGFAQKNDPKTKMLYGIMKELQRSNALMALKLKSTAGIDPSLVDDVMDTDPGRVYQSDAPEADEE